MHLRSLIPIPTARRHLVWLLWVALLLPLAQATTSWHALGHSVSFADTREDGQAPAHGLLCDLCLAGEPISSGALPAVAPALVPAPAEHGRPQALHGRARTAALALAYRSRAPPVTSV